MTDAPPVAGTRLDPSDPSLRELLNGFEGSLARGIATHPTDPEALAVATGAGGFRDLLPILAALDRSGHHDRVRGLLYRYGSRQRLNGDLRLGRGAEEDTACALWSLVDHARLTGDLAYLKAVYRPLRRGLKRLRRMREADGSDRHSGLMRAAGGPAGSRVEGAYALALWSLAGVQEAARAAAALGRSLHRHEGEVLYHELMLALQRSVSMTSERTGTPGLPSGPDLALDEGAQPNLWALSPGDVLRPDDPHLGATLDFLVSGAEQMDLRTLAALGQLLLRRGDPGLWDVVKVLGGRSGRPTDPATGLVGTGQAVWLLRDMLLYDQHELLMIAPAWALRSPDTETELVVEQAPTRFGPVSYMLHGSGGELRISWSGTPRSNPTHILWPLPGEARSVEPPGALVTASRRAIRLPPEGGDFRVRL